MTYTKVYILVFFIFLVSTAGCGRAREAGRNIQQPTLPAASEIVTAVPSSTAPNPNAADLPAAETPHINQPSVITPRITRPTSPTPLNPTATEALFEFGEEITIQFLRDLEITGSEVTFEEELGTTAHNSKHLVSYISEGSRIYGLLTIPRQEPPEGGFKAVIFNHGYIPPVNYRTTEGYTAYVDYLARSGFVVFKIDCRGHGNSEGEATGSYFSPGYTIDSITALKSLQQMDIIDPQGIGMWGHSMAGNLVLRAMLVETDIQAGVIWAGAVYSYDDFAKFGIDDNTYRPPQPSDSQAGSNTRRRSQEIFDTYGRPDSQVDYWKAVSLTENIELLDSPLQLHHAQDDPVVTIGYSSELAAVLQESGKEYEFYIYESGGHNIISPSFDQAMQRTVEYFRNNL